jgi:RNA polymerase sigma-70 factor (ECF subfamily)
VLNLGNKIVGETVLCKWGFVSNSKRSSFESSVSPHMDAAYNLARWLTRNEHDAEDVVQEALLRAFTFFDGFRGVDSRAWMLKIVRNTCFTWLEANRPREVKAVDANQLSEMPALEDRGSDDDPETRALRRTTAIELNDALRFLPRFGKWSFYARWKGSLTRKLRR